MDYYVDTLWLVLSIDKLQRNSQQVLLEKLRISEFTQRCLLFSDHGNYAS